MIIGTDRVCAAMSAHGSGKPQLVLISPSASRATVKKITVKSEFYGIEALEIDMEAEEIGRRLGKTYAPVVLGITDERFAEEIRLSIIS